VLVLVLQFVDGLTDRQAADAVRARLDWKYALGLDLRDPGVDASVLTEFRARLLADGQTERLLQLLLDRLREHGLLRGGGRQRTDATHVHIATHVHMTVRDLHRLEQVIETLRAALEALAVVAVVAPGWLSDLVPGDWARRYGQRGDDVATTWRRLATTWRRRGDDVATTGGCPRLSMPAPSGPSRSAGTATCCWRRSTPPTRRGAGRRRGGAGVAGDLDPTVLP